MNTYNKNHMLIQTFIEVDTQLSQLTKSISAHQYIEIGDDPRLVKNIEELLARLYGKVKSIEPYFDLATTPLIKANIYFILIKHMGDTLKFLQEIKRKDHGSLQHTQKLLDKLRKCTDSLSAIGELAVFNADIIN